MAKGGKLAALMETVKSLGLDIEKIKTQLEIKGKGIAEDEDKLKGVRDGIKEVCRRLFLSQVRDSRSDAFLLLRSAPRQIESSRGPKSTHAAATTTSFNIVKSTFDTTTARLSSDEELLQTLITGLSSSSDDNAAGGYMGQLAEAKARLASAGTEAEQAKVKIEHGERELKEKEPRAKKAAKEGEGLTKELEGARKEREELKTRVAGLEWDEDVESELLQRKAAVSTKMNGLLEVSSLLASTQTRRGSLTFSSPSLLFFLRNEIT